MSTKLKINLNPQWITGFTDAEGSFIVSIAKDKTKKLGFVVICTFMIGLNITDKIILEHIKNYFGVGEIYNHTTENMCRYKVSNFNDLYYVIIPHFIKYPLLTQKYVDFKLFCRVLEIIKTKEHLTNEGLNKIVNIRASMNMGITDTLKANFSSINPISTEDIYKLENQIDENWLLGFINGEACFFISIYKSPKSKLGQAIQLVFKITQHYRDIELINFIVNFLDCGRVEKRSSNGCDFTLTSSYDKLLKKINLNNLLGLKLLDFNDFYKAYLLVKEKKHLTKEGLREIIEIKENMSSRRN